MSHLGKIPVESNKLSTPQVRGITFQRKYSTSKQDPFSSTNTFSVFGKGNRHEKFFGISFFPIPTKSSKPGSNDGHEKN